MFEDAWFLPTTGSSHNVVGPPLRPHGELTIGFGSGGGVPRQFFVGDGISAEVGFLKLYLTTSPVDLKSIQQLTPFGRMDGRHAAPVKAETPDLWATSVVKMIQRNSKGND